MAIVEMDRISVIGLKHDKHEILETLMKLEAVHLTDIWEELKDDVKNCLIIGDDKDDVVAAIEEEMAEIEKVLEYLEDYDKRKKSLLEGRRLITKEEYEDVIKNISTLRSVIRSVKWCEHQIEILLAEKNKCSNRITAMGPWEKVDIPLEKRITRSTVVAMGYMPRKTNISEMEKQLREKAPLCQVLTMNSDKEHLYVCVVCHKSVYNEANSVLDKFGFMRLDFTGLTGTPAEIIKKDTERIRQIEKQHQQFIKALERYAREMGRIEILYDALAMKKELKKSESRLPGTKNTFMLRGWIPSHIGEYVASELTRKWTCSVQIRKTSENEEFPVLLKNNPIGSSVESITELYSLPNPREPDPNTLVGIFFIMFFGLILGDGGYGLIMVLVSSLVLRRKVLEKEMRRFMTLMLFCGISAVFWGAMFGGWFGIPFLTKHPVLLNTMENPGLYLGFALVLGIIHIYVGIGINAVNLIKKKKYLDVFFDVIVWYVFFTGFVFFVLPYAFPEPSQTVNTLVEAGKYMLLVSAVIIVLTRGRANRNVFVRLGAGLGGLYGIIKFLSDVLSYSRLMALGLATTVIGTILFDLATMNGLNSVFGILFFIIVMIVGHVINFGLGLLSAYVHSSRLQYIEFFGRFYKGGGKPFNPLRTETKYINLQEVTHNEYTILGDDR